MHRLKGIIFSLRGVLLKSGTVDKRKQDEIVKLLKYLISVGIKPALVSNTPWELTRQNGEKIPFQTYLSELCGCELAYYQKGMNIISKQNSESMNKILGDHGWKRSEVIYIGNTHHDVIAASSGRFPFINADWHSRGSIYGFKFSSPKDVARFIDCCYLIPKDWFWGLNINGLRVYSIAPLAEHSRYYPSGAIYSSDAKSVVKGGTGQTRFWGLLMAARIHLSGIGDEANYYAPYPGHRVNSQKATLMNAIKILSGPLRAKYIHDLIDRHSDAEKSQKIRIEKRNPTIQNQLNTIRLNPNPTKNEHDQEKYKKFPSIKGKTVLVVDDICTEGYSLETARAFLEAADAKVILVSWLKTPGGSHYHAIKALEVPIGSPTKEYTAGECGMRIHQIDSGIINADADKQIAEAYEKYQDWDWPTGI